MRCETCKKWISDALDRELSGKRRGRLERHLKACPRCRAYGESLTRLQAGAEGLADPGLAPGDWSDFGRRLDSRLRGSVLPREVPERAPLFFRRKWAWAGASFFILAFMGAYFAVLRPRGVREPVFVSLEDSVALVFGEIGSNPELEDSFDQEIMASIAEAVRPPEEEAPVAFDDNPMFWEGLSDGELAYIESALRREQRHGGSS
jgi:hypothetical protein